MRQSVPTYADEDLERVVARDFGRAALVTVMDILGQYGKEAWQQAPLRVRMACLKLADGNLERLESEVAGACRDYRDALVWAEYPAWMRATTREQRQQAIDDDWRALQVWLDRG